MFLISGLFLVAFLRVGESLDGGKQATAFNNSSLNLILGDQCVTRDEVQAVIQTEVQAIYSFINNLVDNLVEIQQNNTNLLFQAINPGSLQNPATSCKSIPNGSPSGDYWIQTDSGTTQQYCDMNRKCCGSTGGWMRVANLDMTDPNQQCPSGFKLVTSPRRSCGRLLRADRQYDRGYVSTMFPVNGVKYSRVCGRVIGYQYGYPEGFIYPNIDGVYVHGVSLTYGQFPRKHIWTFTNARDELGGGCPCTRPDMYYAGDIPSFVGQDYFCETGSRNAYELGRFYYEDPLWDGKGCGPRSTCCTFNNPPWFCKQLPQPTKDDIELRLCGDYDTEDSPIEIVELYVQ